MSIRIPGQKVISVSLPQTLIDDIDARAASLGLSRSAYLSLLARQDLSNPTSSAIPTPPGQPSAGAGATTGPAAAEAATENAQPLVSRPLDLTAEVYEFLLRAIPALEAYEAAKAQGGDKTPGPPTVDIPDDIAESTLWRFFLLEMDEILRHKYLRSQQVGHDIGLNAAIKEWLQMHRALWAAAHKPQD